MVPCAGASRAKMIVFLLSACFLCPSPVRSLFEGECPRKDPPPGVVVVSPGGELLLTCSGDVKVNGVKVILTRSGSNTSKKRSSSILPTTQKPASTFAVFTENEKSDLQTAPSAGYDSSTTVATVSAVPGENRNLRPTGTPYTASLHAVWPTTRSRAPEGKSDRRDEGMDGGYEAEEVEESSRLTRGIHVKAEWKWNRQSLQKKDRDRGEIAFSRDGTTLTLASVRLTDAGKYTCHQRSRETTAVKVIVADPPESPRLFCYKKSPSSKIRCEWRPQKPISKQPHCYLSLKRRQLKNSHQSKIPCSYSSQHSYCWCTLDDNEDERRTQHEVFLCVTSIIGNATSPLLYFTPLDILKPDPPTNVSVHQEQGQRRRLRVTWSLPASWREKGDFYLLIYELKYRPLTSSNEQVNTIRGSTRSYMITDALSGFDYVIQLRMKEEYDGQWSEWSSPVNSTSWTETDDPSSTELNWISTEDSGSATDICSEDYITSSPVDSPHEVPHYIVWIACLFALLSVILTVYVFRHKAAFMSKLHGFNVTSQLGDFPPPPSTATAAPEGEALVTFVPQLYKERPLNDTQEGEENEEEQTVMDRIEAMDFNNTSYFLLQRQL